MEKETADWMCLFKKVGAAGFVEVQVPGTHLRSLL